MRCSNCGHELKNSCSVCPICGQNTRGFGAANGSFGSSQSTSSNFNTQGGGFNAGSFDSPNFCSAPVQKKQSKAWILVLVCAMCVFILLAAVFAIGSALGTASQDDLGSYTYSQYDTIAPQPSLPVVLPYTTTEEEPLAPTPKPIIVKSDYENEETASATAATSVTTATTNKVTTTTATTASESEESDPSEIIPFFEIRYFVNQMNDDALEVFCALYEGAMNFEKKIELPYTVTPDQLSAFMVLLNHECPELFQIDHTKSYTYYYKSDPNKIHTVELPYLVTKNEYEKMRAECEAVIDSYVAATNGLSDIEKEKYVFDQIATKSYYLINADYTGIAYGALIRGYAKCDGFSLAMKWAMETMGIQCLCVSGDDRFGGIGHAWNIINIDGNYYQLDLTFSVPSDDSVDFGINFPVYQGFNTSDTWIRENYSLKSAYTMFTSVPRCTITRDSYYANLGGLVRTGEDPIEVITAELDDLAKGRSERIYLQFENPTEYASFKNNANHYIEQALSNYDANWSSYNSFWQDYYTFIIIVK